MEAMIIVMRMRFHGRYDHRNENEISMEGMIIVMRMRFQWKV